MNNNKNNINSNDEILKEFCIGKDLKIRKIKYGNKDYIDIRRYYNDYPMKKGIRLNETDFEKLKDILINNF